jgi:hypothetical protein
MEDSMTTAISIIQHLGCDMKTSWERRRITLPCSRSETGMQVWNSGGEDCRAMPCQVKPLTHDLEKRLVCCLIEEIRTKLGLELEPMPSFDRRLGSQSKPKKKVEFSVLSGLARLWKTWRVLPT